MSDSTRIKRFNLLIRLAANEEEKTSTQLAAARQNMDDANAQLANLREYESGYLTSNRSAHGASVNPYSLSSFQQFVSQVAGAIEQQEQVVRHANAQFENARTLWVEAREKRKSLERLRDEAQHKLDISRDKKEEARLLDDYVAIKYRSK